jgi:hypothetical protein
MGVPTKSPPLPSSAKILSFVRCSSIPEATLQLTQGLRTLRKAHPSNSRPLVGPMSPTLKLFIFSSIQNDFLSPSFRLEVVIGEEPTLIIGF